MLSSTSARSGEAAAEEEPTLSIKAAESANEFTTVRLCQRKLEMQRFNPRLAGSRVGCVHYLPGCSDAGVLARFHPL